MLKRHDWPVDALDTLGLNGPPEWHVDTLGLNDSPELRLDTLGLNAIPKLRDTIQKLFMITVVLRCATPKLLQLLWFCAIRFQHLFMITMVLSCTTPKRLQLL